MRKHLAFGIENRAYEGKFALYGRRISESGNTNESLMPVDIQVIPPEEEHYPIDPFIILTRDEAQLLIDEMWKAGLRPRHKVEEASQIEAVNRHLQDMRTIAFKYINLVGTENEEEKKLRP